MVRLLAVALALGACSSEGRGPVTDALVERLEDILPGGPPPAPPRRAAALTRAQVEAAGTTMIRGGLTDAEDRAILSGVTVNDGFVTYASRFGQTVTLQGGLITASRGVGYDLLAVSPEADDPVARPRPPQDWPQQIERLYTLPGPGPEGQTVRVTCTFVRLQPETLEIVERSHETVVFEERCRGDARFVNAHHADIETGTVWQSTQWIGPVQGAFTYEMIEPFAPD